MTRARSNRTALLLLAWALACGAAWASGPLERTIHVEIPKGTPLDTALVRLAQAITDQTGLHVMVASESIGHAPTEGLSGTLPAGVALARLLQGTGLIYQTADDTVAIKPAPVREVAGSGSFRPSQSRQEGEARADTGIGTGENGRSGLEDSGRQPIALQEVVVTAQKKSENVLSVPVPVSVISADALVETGQVRLQDYYARIPGLSVAPDDFGGTTVTIRGISTGDYTNPTVGITVDDIPFGSSTALGNPEVPDFDPSDLSHIEVLRGPQGTLYGASSLGGLIKYVTVDPSTEAVSGRVEADVDGVDHGDGPGYGTRAAVNLPLSDDLAVRASGFARRDAGYVDNVLTGQDGVNWGNVSGGRLAGLWRPSQDFSVKLSAMFENSATHGSPNVEPGVGVLLQSNVRNVGGFDRSIQMYGAVVKAALGPVRLTSLTGYGVNQYNDSYDFSNALGALVQYGVPGTGFNGFGVGGAPVFVFGRTDKLTQELRLTGGSYQRIEWLVGLFYDHEDSPSSENILAADASSGIAVGQLAHIVFPSTYAEYAGFADLTFHFGDSFNVQLGGRESRNRQSYMETYYGDYDLVAFGTPGPYVQPLVHSQDDSFTYLVTPQYKLSSHLMIYARLASGYRPGGPNINGAAAGLPSVYRPDTTRNYEVGAKGELPNHALSFDASVYYIDWRNIQLYLTDPTTDLAYNSNGSKAKSQGLEFSVGAKPLRGLSVAAWAAWNEAVLTESFPVVSSAIGNAGDRLPYSSPFSGSLSVDQEFPIGARASGSVGADLSYVGDRQGSFAAAGGPTERQGFPGYAKVDVHVAAGVDGWDATLFCNNLTDRRAALNGGLGTYNPAAFIFIQPRTVGLSVSRSF